MASILFEAQDYNWEQARHVPFSQLGSQPYGASVDVYGTVAGANGSVVATCKVYKGGGGSCTPGFIELTRDSSSVAVEVSSGFSFEGYPYRSSDGEPQFVAGTEIQVVGTWDGAGTISASLVAGTAWSPDVTPSRTALNATWIASAVSCLVGGIVLRRRDSIAARKEARAPNA